LNHSSSPITRFLLSSDAAVMCLHGVDFCKLIQLLS
jgi:hypothetical protein